MLAYIARCKISWMRKEYHPFAAVVRKADRAEGGGGGKIGSIHPDAQRFIGQRKDLLSKGKTAEMRSGFGFPLILCHQGMGGVIKKLI